MNGQWVVIIVHLFIFYYSFVSGKTRMKMEPKCGNWTDLMLSRALSRRKGGKSQVINWKMNIVPFGSQMSTADPSSAVNRPMMSPDFSLKDYVICPNLEGPLKDMSVFSSVTNFLCRGLMSKKKKVSLGLPPKPSHVNFGKMVTNFISLKAVADDKQRRSLKYLVHMTSSLGIPSMTWFAGSVGNIEMEEKPLMLHLEPGHYHVAEAIVDFLYSYNWKVITVVVSKHLPGYELFLKAMNKVRDERKKDSNSKHFILDIANIFYVERRVSHKLISRKCRKYRSPGSRVCPFGPYDKILSQIYKAEARVVILHGRTEDLYFFSYFSKKYKDTLFGKKYVWIMTPSSTKLQSSGEKDSDYSAQLVRGAQMPGMFGFAYDNSNKAYEKALRYAMRVFKNGLTEVVKKLKAERMDKNANVDLSEILLPNFTCLDKAKETEMFWDLGPTLHEKMKQTIIVDNKQHIGFLPNGYINTTQLMIMNTRLKSTNKRSGTMTRWFKVGTWTMSDTVTEKDNLQIFGITFSGGLNQPPSGMPRKAVLRVATLKERPFVVYSMPNNENNCDQNTIECYVNPSSMNTSDPQSEFATTENRTNTTKACCGGLTIDLLLEIKRDLNFDVSLFEVEDRTWGIKTEKGWNGLVNVLLEKKADMVVTSFKITPNRSAAVDFSIPFQETGITIVVALREGKISHTAFLEPYDFSSWCVILIFSVHACGAALFVYEWLSPQGLDRGNVAPRENGSSDKDHRFSLFRSLWLIWSMLFSASVNADNPRGVASRVLASIWALFALVFLASYTANLAAFMIAKEEFYNLKGIKDNRLMEPFGHKPPFRFASVPSGATEENIRINFPKMFQYMRTYNKSSVAEGIKALKDGEIDAFIYDAYVLDYMEAHDEKCKLKTVRNWFAMTGYGIAFPKNSKWLKKVNEKILAYQKNGKMQRWKKFWLSGNCKKSNQLGNTNKTLGVKNFISAFILLVGGMILCTVLLLLEHAFYRYMRPRIKSWDKYGCCGLVSISMGQLLSFEQSVNQTVDLIKHHKCKNPICETQLWKARHELDMARRKIKKLEAAWNRNAIEQEMRAAAAISFSEPTTSASIPALPSAPPDSTIIPSLGATGLCHSSTPDMDFLARSEPALNEEPNPVCSCHLNNPPYPSDDATSEHSRLLPPALPPRALNAQSDWQDPEAPPAGMHYPRPPLGPSRHHFHHHHHQPYSNEPSAPLIRRPKSSGNIAINNKYNPPQYEMIEKESVL